MLSFLLSRILFAPGNSSGVIHARRSLILPRHTRPWFRLIRILVLVPLLDLRHHEVFRPTHASCGAKFRLSPSHAVPLQ